jgi:ubiquinone/menaquinone biosynthesis C-methylase UbiE
MNMDQEQKEAITKKYDDEAEEIDTPTWLALDGDIRVPEPGAGHYFVERKVAMALKLSGDQLSPQARVLEIGCSFGQMTALLARRFSNLTAIDISPRSVQIAEKRLHSYGVDGVHFAVDDAESLLSVPDNSFDAVFSFSTLRFCPQPDKALRAIKDKLRANGIAIIDFPNKMSPWHLFVKPLLKIKPHVHDRLYTPREAVQLFTKAGFTVEQVKCFLFTSRRLPTFLIPTFAAIDFVLERAPLFPKLAGIIMVKGIKK